MVRRPLRYYYLRLMRQPGTPEEIAGGMAIGLFAALVVPPGFQIATAVVLSFLLRLNRISALVGCLLTNPLTWPFIIYLQMLLGGLFTGTYVHATVPDQYDSWWLYLRDYHSSWEILKTIFIGAGLTGLLTAVAGYWITKLLVNGYRVRKQKRDEARRAAGQIGRRWRRRSEESVSDS